jgi:hypothetical protein
MRRVYEGCGVAMWLARRAAVRQSRVRIPPGTLPWFSPGKSRSRKVSEQIFHSTAAGDSSAAASVSAHHRGWILYQYCRQKIRKINKKSAGKGTKNLNLKVYWHKLCRLKAWRRVYELLNVSASQKTVQSFLYTGSMQTVYLRWPHLCTPSPFSAPTASSKKRAFWGGMFAIISSAWLAC